MSFYLKEPGAGQDTEELYAQDYEQKKSYILANGILLLLLDLTFSMIGFFALVLMVKGTNVKDYTTYDFSFFP